MRDRPVCLTSDVCSEDRHPRQCYSVELVSQSNVVCCPHISIAQLVKREEADWTTCATAQQVQHIASHHHRHQCMTLGLHWLLCRQHFGACLLERVGQTS